MSQHSGPCTKSELCETCNLDAKEDRAERFDIVRAAIDRMDPDAWMTDAGRWTCSEAEALVEAFRALDLDDLARDFMEAHAEGDEPGDDHYDEDADDETDDTPDATLEAVLNEGTWTFWRAEFLPTGEGDPEQMAAGAWLSMARDNVHDVVVAVRHGFLTGGARYWAELVTQ